MPTPEPLSPEWWRDRLLKKYAADYEERLIHASYYDSTNPIPSVPDGTGDLYPRLLGMSKTPWGRLVVDIVAERIVMQGFNIKDDDDLANGVWNIFRKNRIEAVQRQVTREAIALGTSYVSVWGNGPNPSIAYESSLCMTHETLSGSPSEVAAVSKVWFDTISNRIRVNLFLADKVYRWESESTGELKNWRISIKGESPTVRWQPFSEPVPTYGMTVVPFLTRPSWDGYGTSDLEDLLPSIQRIESITSSTLLAIELGALRQKWATGLEVPMDEAGNPTNPMKLAFDRLLVSEEPETKFGVFGATDVQPYLSAVSDAVGQLSAVSRIPTLYFNQSELSNPPSAASLEASETGLIHRVIERRTGFAESWEMVAEKVIQVADGELPEAPFDIVWKDPRTRSEGQVLDAAVKLASMDTPWEAVMEFIGYTKTEIADLKAKRAADTFDRLIRSRSELPRATEIVTEEPADNDG